MEQPSPSHVHLHSQQMNICNSILQTETNSVAIILLLLARKLSTLKTEATYSSETSVLTRLIRFHNPEYAILHIFTVESMDTKLM